MQSVIVAVKMLFVVLVIFLVNGYIEAQDYQQYGKRGEIANEVQVQGSVSIKGVNCREGETLGSCCPPNCEATCHRPHIPGLQNRKSSVCLEKCVCKEPLVRRMDRRCVPRDQCQVKMGPYN